MALCFAVLLTSTMMAASVAHAEWSESDETVCTNDWQPAECGPDIGPFNPSLGQHIVIGKDPNSGLAYAEARDEADHLCSSYKILKVRFTKLPVQWKVAITIDC